MNEVRFAFPAFLAIIAAFLVLGIQPLTGVIALAVVVGVAWYNIAQRDDADEPSLELHVKGETAQGLLAYFIAQRDDADEPSLELHIKGETAQRLLAYLAAGGTEVELERALRRFLDTRAPPES